jgi:hypothetical protein
MKEVQRLINKLDRDAQSLDIYITLARERGDFRQTEKLAALQNEIQQLIRAYREDQAAGLLFRTAGRSAFQGASGISRVDSTRGNTRIGPDGIRGIGLPK